MNRLFFTTVVTLLLVLSFEDIKAQRLIEGASGKFIDHTQGFKSHYVNRLNDTIRNDDVSIQLQFSFTTNQPIKLTGLCCQKYSIHNDSFDYYNGIYKDIEAATLNNKYLTTGALTTFYLIENERRKIYRYPTHILRSKTLTIIESECCNRYEIIDSINNSYTISTYRHLLQKDYLDSVIRFIIFYKNPNNQNKVEFIKSNWINIGPGINSSVLNKSLNHIDSILSHKMIDIESDVNWFDLIDHKFSKTELCELLNIKPRFVIDASSDKSGLKGYFLVLSNIFIGLDNDVVKEILFICSGTYLKEFRIESMGYYPCQLPISIDGGWEPSDLLESFGAAGIIFYHEAYMKHYLNEVYTTTIRYQHMKIRLSFQFEKINDSKYQLRNMEISHY